MKAYCILQSSPAGVAADTAADTDTDTDADAAADAATLALPFYVCLFVCFTLSMNCTFFFRRDRKRRLFSLFVYISPASNRIESTL